MKTGRKSLCTRFFCKLAISDEIQHASTAITLYAPAPVPSACMHPQHEVLIITECLLASTGDAGPTFNKHQHCTNTSIVQMLYSKHEALNQCWFDAGPASQTVGQHWTRICSTSCVLGVQTSTKTE